MKTVRTDDWKTPLGLALIGYYLVMAVVGMLIPDDILKANAWAREFSDFMASIVPQIDRITALGIKPDVNRFYFSVLWAGSPLFLLILALTAWNGYVTGLATIWQMTFIRSLPLVVLAVSLAFLSFDVHWLIDPNMRLSRTVFGTGLGRGLVGQTIALSPTSFGLGALPQVRVWRERRPQQHRGGAQAAVAAGRVRTGNWQQEI